MKRVHCWSKSPLPSTAVRQQMGLAMKYMHDNTHANRLYHANCDTSGAGQTDVAWWEQNAVNAHTP
jgi:hypothetical protein